jgi:hypothetical protein
MKRPNLPPVEKWTVADWLDLHETIEAFRRRIEARHKKLEPATETPKQQEQERD